MICASWNSKLVYSFESLSPNTRHGSRAVHFTVLAPMYVSIGLSFFHFIGNFILVVDVIIITIVSSFNSVKLVHK